VARGLKSIHDLTTSAARKRCFSRREAQEILSRVSGTTDYSGFRRAQLVVEAVFEDLEVKRKVIAELEAQLAPEAVIASNTSSLPIGSLAAEAKHPERVVGMHFFSPVHRMPLLEVIRAEQTSEAALATAVEAGRKMGKTVIVVNDGPGFYTTRVLGFMGQEARHLFEEGASVEDVDRALTRFGFPIGPFALADEVGIDVSAHVAEVLSASFPGRFTSSASTQRMLEAGRLGRKSKLGFYDYRGRRKKVDPAVYSLRQAAPQRFPEGLVQQRLVLAFLNEAARCLEEGVIACPRDGDVGAVMGVAFPPFLGGPFRYADSLGLPALVGQLHQLENAYGSRFAPAPILVRLAEDGSQFHP
jgi:3-hydroxyacyl-CoA dehydrogenase/enoyl-CoA hydratase/3-hydroxybutyryl-CoA epimerase